jgi:hypothetical protein
VMIIGKDNICYVVLSEPPHRYRKKSTCNHAGFVDKLNHEIDIYYVFCHTLFEKRTGVKLRVGEWKDFKLVEVKKKGVEW